MTPQSSSSRDTMRYGNNKHCMRLVVILAAALCAVVVHGFSNPNLAKTLPAGNVQARPQQQQQQPLFMSSFSADGSEYSSKDSDYDTDEMETRTEYKGNDDEDEVETVEQQPVPMSKNAGNRFVALYWDHELEQNKAEGDPRESWWLHYDRDDLNEDHVMYCRKHNLYNETFNQDSMVDVMRSLPM